MVNGAKEVFPWHKDIVEYQFASVRATHTELVKLAGTGETGRGVVDNEGCDTFGAFIRLCLCVHDDVVCIWTLRWECLSKWDKKFARTLPTLVIHILVPFKTQPSSTDFAVVFILTTSDPAECSDMASAPIFIPDIKLGRKRAFWSEVPFRQS